MLNPENAEKWSDEQLLSFVSILRRVSKPMIIAANKMDIPIAQENYTRIKFDHPELTIIPCSAEAELALKEAMKHQLIKYIPGEEVTILDGPFSTFHGKIESVKGDKVKVEVSVFGRVSLIELNIIQIDKKTDK